MRVRRNRSEVQTQPRTMFITQSRKSFFFFKKKGCLDAELVYPFNKMRLVIAIFGSWARRQVLHIEISNGRIDFKFVLK